MSREKLEHLRWYYGHFPRNKDNQKMLSLINALIDKKWGMGLLWGSTNFEEIKTALEKFGNNTVIGRDRDFLFSLVDKELSP